MSLTALHIFQCITSLKVTKFARGYHLLLAFGERIRDYTFVQLTGYEPVFYGYHLIRAAIAHFVLVTFDNLDFTDEDFIVR